MAADFRGYLALICVNPRKSAAICVEFFFERKWAQMGAN
jgi:hypothetical protein